jgi:integrase/recombinase XerD
MSRRPRARSPRRNQPPAECAARQFTFPVNFSRSALPSSPVTASMYSIVESFLRGFVEFSSHAGKAHICAQTSIAWAAQGSSPPQRSFRLKTVACFARYLSAEDPWHEVPPDDFFGSYRIRRRISFIFTIADINRLVERASMLGPPGSLRPHTYSTLLALLAITGMRVSEGLALRFEDVMADGSNRRGWS